MIENGMKNDANSMTVRTDFMEQLMNNVFTLPRNVVGYSKNRDAVGGLIFGTFAVSGLMVRTESFKFSPISSEDNKQNRVSFLILRNVCKFNQVFPG